MDADEFPGLSFRPADMYVISSLEELRTIANPLRLSILDCLIAAPCTVKEVGKILGISSTKLYYHVAELEKVRLVRLVHTEVQSGIQVKYYRAVANYYYLSGGLLHRNSETDRVDVSTQYLAAHFERGARDLRRSIADGSVERHWDTFVVSRRRVRMTSARAAEFRRALEELDREYRDAEEPTGDVTTEFIVALFPTDG